MKLSDSLPGLASIIIPSCNPLESTRQCIDELTRYTRRPWELIVVDDGSSDEMSAYLESVREAVSVPVTVIAGATSRWIAAAINQGLKAARGEYLVLLNNDVVVTDGWLGQLIALANAKPGGPAHEFRRSLAAVCGRLFARHRTPAIGWSVRCGRQDI